MNIFLFMLAFAEPLFKGSPTQDHVRQGSSGTCYFHAVMASAANQDPTLLTRRMSEKESILPLLSSKYFEIRVGKYTESVYPKDALSFQAEHSDRSTGGLWVPAMLKAYGQMLLRKGIVKYISNQDQEFLTSLLQLDPMIVSSIDSAVRTAINPEGKLNRSDFQNKLRVRGVPNEIIQLSMDTGFIDILEEVVQSNPEAFDAEYLMGKGGYSLVVAENIFNYRCRRIGSSSPSLYQEVSSAINNKNIVTISSKTQCVGSNPSWFTENHAFAVLDTQNSNFIIRNPWSSRLTPFQASLNDISSCMHSVTICQP